MSLSKNVKFTSLVGLGIILSKLSGFAKNYVIVNTFGLSDNTDAFFVANNISDIIINLLISGLVIGALIPIFADIKSKHKGEYYSLFLSKVLLYIGIISIIFSLSISIFSIEIAKILAPGLSADSQLIVSNLFLILAPGIIFLGLVSVYNGILTVEEKYFLASIGLFVANSVTILCILAFKNSYGIYSAAIGTSVGFFFWFLSNLKAVKYVKTNTIEKIYNRHYSLLCKLAIPAVIILIINNAVFIIEKYLASSFSAGTITKLTFTYRVVFIVANIVVLPIGTVLLPAISKKVGIHDYKGVLSSLKKTFVVVFLGLFFILTFNYINKDSISRLIYFFITDEFYYDSETVNYFTLYSFSYVGLFTYMILSRVSYGFKKSYDLIAANLIGIIFYLTFTYVFIWKIGPKVLPAAFAGSTFVCSSYLYIKIKYKYFGRKVVLFPKSVLLKGTFIIGIIVLLGENTTIFSYSHFINFGYSIMLMTLLLYVFKYELKFLYNEIRREKNAKA